MNETTVATTGSTDIEQAGVTTTPDMLSIIAEAAKDPSVDVEKMRALLAMHDRLTAEQRRIAWHDAMSWLQKEMPRVARLGIGAHGSYALLEDIQAVAKPLLSDAGFSIAYDETLVGDLKRVTVRLCRAGHSEEFSAFVPHMDDTGPGRNKTQAMASSSSYGRRRALINALNIEVIGEDDDGAGGHDRLALDAKSSEVGADGLEPITDDQVLDIETALVDTKSDRAKFLRYMRVESIADILTRDYRRAMAAIDTKRRSAR